MPGGAPGEGRSFGFNETPKPTVSGVELGGIIFQESDYGPEENRNIKRLHSVVEHGGITHEVEFQHSPDGSINVQLAWYKGRGNKIHAGYTFDSGTLQEIIAYLVENGISSAPNELTVLAGPKSLETLSQVAHLAVRKAKPDIYGARFVDWTIHKGDEEEWVYAGTYEGGSVHAGYRDGPDDRTGVKLNKAVVGAHISDSGLEATPIYGEGKFSNKSEEEITQLVTDKIVESAHLQPRTDYSTE